MRYAKHKVIGRKVLQGWILLKITKDERGQISGLAVTIVAAICLLIGVILIPSVRQYLESMMNGLRGMEKELF